MQHLGPDGSVADEADVEDHIVAHSFEPAHRVRALQADKLYTGSLILTRT